MNIFYNKQKFEFFFGFLFYLEAKIKFTIINLSRNTNRKKRHRLMKTAAYFFHFTHCSVLTSHQRQRTKIYRASGAASRPRRTTASISKSWLYISFIFENSLLGTCGSGSIELEQLTYSLPNFYFVTRKEVKLCRLQNKSSPSGAPQKISPRTVRQLKTTSLESDSASSSNQASRTPKDKSPKVIERRSPRSPVSEKKRPNKVTELESQISKLQEDLKKAKDQLSSSESWKRSAQQDAEESKKQLSAMSSKLEESQRQLLELSASEEDRVIELQKISQERDRAWESELRAVEKQHSVDSAALASAMSEIQRLKSQLEMKVESQVAQTKHTESADSELHSLKENLAETLSLVENMKNQLKDSKESEAQAQALASETLLQLETAKSTIEALRTDGIKAAETYNSISLELNESRARVNFLEGLVSKLKTDLTEARSSSPNYAELASLKIEVGQLKSALDAAEIRYHEEHVQSTVQIRSAYEHVEHVKSASSSRQAELQVELEKTKADIEELKANLMDKETELQEYELERELKKSKEDVAKLKENLMDKETEFQYVVDENETLKLEMKKREMDKGKFALLKLGYVMEEADKSSRRAARVAEQLEATQVANSEMEAELRKLKVQSDQWRKAAEAAAAMLSAGSNGKSPLRRYLGGWKHLLLTIESKLGVVMDTICKALIMVCKWSVCLVV
ncbi:unnamed protein product, partial [Vitis vinifera]